MTNAPSSRSSSDSGDVLPRPASRSSSGHPGSPEQTLETFDTVLSLFSRMKQELEADVLSRLRADIERSAPKLAAEELERSGTVRKLAATEIDARARMLGKWIGGVSIVLALAGFASLTAMVDGIVSTKVEAVFERQEARLDSRMTKLEEERAKGIEELRRVVTDLHGEVRRDVSSANLTIQEKLLSARAEIDAVAKEAVDAVGHKRGEAEVALKELGDGRERDLKAVASTATLQINEVARRANGEIRDFVGTSIREIAKDSAKEDRKRGGDASRLDEVKLEALDLVDRRLFDDVLQRMLAHAGSNDSAAQAIQVLLFNRQRYNDRLLEIVQVLLSKERSQQDRARVATEALVAGVLAGNAAVVARVEAEKADNVLVRLTWSQFDQFLLEASRFDPSDAASRQALLEQFARVDVDDLTGVGLSNLLAIAKHVHLPEDSILAIESRVIRAATEGIDGKGGVIDGASDYSVAYAVMESLVADPRQSSAVLIPVANRIQLHVFDAEHRDMDPWGLRDLLGRARE